MISTGQRWFLRRLAGAAVFMLQLCHIGWVSNKLTTPLDKEKARAERELPAARRAVIALEAEARQYEALIPQLKSDHQRLTQEVEELSAKRERLQNILNNLGASIRSLREEQRQQTATN
jgi:septal ring factor EnvC (AmiA/AmiB activator)